MCPKEHMIRYYGSYSNATRGKRKKLLPKSDSLQVQELPVSPSSFRKRWAQLIKKVYELDPLLCPNCSGTMKIIAFIQEQFFIDRILAHLGLLQPNAHSHTPPLATPAQNSQSTPAKKFLQENPPSVRLYQ